MKFQFTLLAFCISTFIYAQSVNQNYNQVIEPKIAISVSNYEAGAYNLHTDILETVEYLDGFNTVLQTISKKASPEYKDLVNFADTDEFGRQTKTYFPFLVNQQTSSYVTDAKNIQKAYYQNKFNDLTAFTEVRLDGSPLNRIVEKSKGGDIWKLLHDSDSDKTEKYFYGINQTKEIKRYLVDGNGLINNSLYYENLKLLKSTVKSENWKSTDGNLNTAEVYTDLEGKKIAEISYVQDGLKVEKLITQYLYDERGLLRYILPPKASSHDFQAYNSANGSLRWNFNRFLSNENTSGGGSVVATIQNGVLSVTLSAGFSISQLKTGPVVYIDDRIPNVNLGNIACNSCNGNYRLYVEDGFLSIAINTYPIATTAFSGTYTATVGNITLLSNQQLLDKYAFQYKYDDYNRKIEQKTPGKGWEYNVFDQLDRPILTQDQNLKAQGVWLFTKFDSFGRTVYTGNYNSLLTREALQIEADTYIINNTTNRSNVEKKLLQSIQIAGINVLYSNNTFPVNVNEILSINYYDDYHFTDEEFGIFPEVPIAIDGGQVVTSNTRGLLTGSLVKYDGGYYKLNKILYNEKALPIYEEYDLFLIYAFKNSTIINYDFRGNITTKVVENAKRDGRRTDVTKVTSRFEYDHAERILAEFQKINEQEEEAIVKYIYDDIGILSQKKVGGLTTAVNSLQTVSYKHNIRGWLTKINDPLNLGTSLFAYEVKYDAPNSGSTPLYTGNISQVFWKSALPNSGLKSYNYLYDNLNRLTEAKFTDSTSPANGNSFFEKLSYDSNGNITSVNRSGNVLSNPELINMDVMDYQYDGNQLASIIETGIEDEGYKSDLTASIGVIYEYDANGNLIKDRNKDIVNIIYNHLDLIESVQFSNNTSVEFRYDASGNKICKIINDGRNQTKTYYIGGFQYTGDDMFFPTSEGYAIKTDTGFKYVYVYSDQLGNNRLSYCDVNNNGLAEVSEIQSVNDYYALGMTHSGAFTNALASSYLYKFQGKEFNEEKGLNMYDFGSRMYDPAVGRWFSADPQNQFASPYVAMGNCFVIVTDPNGEWAGFDDLAAMAIGGTVNLVSNALSGNVNDWQDGFAYFAIGAAAGEATLYGGPLAGALVLGAGNDVYNQYKVNNNFDDYNVGQTIAAAGMSVATTAVGAGIGNLFSKNLTSLFSKVGGNQIFKDFAIQATSSIGTGFTMGFGTSTLQGMSFEDSFNVGIQSAGNALVMTSVSYGAGSVQNYYKNKQEVNQQVVTTKQKEFYQTMESGLPPPPKEAGISTIQLNDKPVHGNSLASLKPTWGYKLFSNDGTFLKNGITSKELPESRYTKTYMQDKHMEAIQFPVRLEAYKWEYSQNMIQKGPLNLNNH